MKNDNNKSNNSKNSNDSLVNYFNNKTIVMVLELAEYSLTDLICYKKSK